MSNTQEPSPSNLANPAKLGLLGHGISYSLSPKIHKFSFDCMEIAGEYQLFDIAPDDLPDFLKDFAAAGGLGFNITKPYKSKVAELIGAQIGSCNTVVMDSSGRWRGDSTDGPGFCAGLGHAGRSIHDFSRVLILGDGGAAQALTAHLSGSESYDGAVTLLARKVAQGESITEPGGGFPVLPLHVDVLREEIAKDCEGTLLIQATSAPLAGHGMGELIPALKEFSGVFVDLVYGQVSDLYHHCRGRGLVVQDGLPMLIEQARRSQEIWFGRCAPYQPIHDMVSSQS